MQLIYKVERAILFCSKTKPLQIVISAVGEVPSTGWSHGELGFWYYVHPPKDGIQDLDFLAQEPGGISLPVVTPIAATVAIERDPKEYWGPKKPLVGVRIHSRTNTIEATFDESPELAISPFSGGMPLPWPFPWSAAGGDLPFPYRIKGGNSQADLIAARVRIRGGNTE